MQPGYLLVFDGLRVSTEHLEHFQDSLHSALGDLRRIAGVGRVHRGFTVTAADGGRSEVIVQPGLAFDNDGRRLVSDETISLSVPPLAGSSRAFVCASYLTVEQGIVDGRPTLGFDSATVELRTAPPALGENVLVLATLTAPASDSSAPFDIVVPAAPGKNGSTPASATVASAPSSGNGAAPSAATPPAGVTSGDAATSAAPDRSSKDTSSVSVKQGVVRLRGDDASRDALTVLARAMKRSATDAEAPVPAVSLATTVLATAMHVSSWTIHAAWTVTLRGETTLRARGFSHGEASADGADALTQSCISQSEIRVTAGDQVVHRSGSAISQSLVGGVPFKAPDESEPAGTVPEELLAGLLVTATLGVPTQEGQPLACRLVWDGPVSTSLQEWLGTHPIELAWSADIIWKAIGAASATAVLPPSA